MPKKRLRLDTNKVVKVIANSQYRMISPAYDDLLLSYLRAKCPRQYALIIWYDTNMMMSGLSDKKNTHVINVLKKLEKTELAEQFIQNEMIIIIFNEKDPALAAIKLLPRATCPPVALFGPITKRKIINLLADSEVHESKEDLEKGYWLKVSNMF